MGPTWNHEFIYSPSIDMMILTAGMFDRVEFNKAIEIVKRYRSSMNNAGDIMFDLKKLL
ncbi:MAG: hypothetical protein HC814_06550, partial [Rhodobacteraceae bacterium]|nr:hypothetical protein [Paracoccaceae bacterium]